jgi:hypothetical protein
LLPDSAQPLGTNDPTAVPVSDGGLGRKFPGVESTVVWGFGPLLTGTATGGSHRKCSKATDKENRRSVDDCSLDQLSS